MMKSTVKLTSMVAVLYLFTGYQELSAQTKDSLKEKQIEEVVMIGYGTAKKVDLTSSISTVKSAEIVKTPSGQAAQALQGKVAGVQISSFGSPGDTPQINIRGIKSLYGDNQPLYVVDGIFVDNIDFLNSNDIQDFTVLKDASASAIYGVKAANGVVVITTKGGSYNRKPKLSFDTYFGVQSAYNVTKMANAEQFTNFALESGSASEIASIEKAIQRFGRSRINPNIPDVNTDWYKETLRLAAIQNYGLSVDGGSEKISYSLGGDFFNQEGILKMKNSYERFNVRAKIDAKAKDWLTVGTSLIFSRSEKYDDESSAWQQIYYAVPILPVYDYSYTNAFPSPYADAMAIGYRDHQNPFALLDNSDRLGVRTRTVVNVYADVSLIPKELTFKSSLSYNNKSDVERTMLLPYFSNSDFGFQRTLAQSSITRNSFTNENYIWDNVLTYNKRINDHDITLMAGTSYRDDYYNYFGVQGFFYDGSPFSRDREQTWYIRNTSVDGRISNDFGTRFYGTSYFGRLAYKFKNRYIAYATFRKEGSNKYTEKYVNLPAIGVSWVVSEESFLKDINWLNLLKLRAGWGRLANDAIGNNRPSTALAANTVFNDNYVSGSQFSTYKDNLGWEFTEETNVGASLELFNRKLTIEADYFIKDTKNLAIPVLPIVGTESSFANVGSVRNKGFEISAGWKGKVGTDWGYFINGNFSKIDNEVTSLNGQPFLDRGMAEFRQRLVVGQPMDVFYGWDIVGVYQNQAEVNADAMAQYANGQSAGTVKPGYFKYRDVNGDGILDANDRVYLGSPVPTYYYGGSLGLNYKNWDLSVAFYGQGGNLILNRNRAEVFRTAGRNIDAELAINRWHGEGTTNEYTSSEGYRNGWNQRNSKFFLEKGDFFRLQNVQLGYTFKSSSLPEMRFTITADRPYLWSKSKVLMNPEVAANGVDLGVYPTPSVFTFGYSVKF